MIPEKCFGEMSEKEFSPLNMDTARRRLESFERAKILEVYFARVDGRDIESARPELEELYSIELLAIKSFLLEQHPLDPILHSILKVVH